MGGRKKSCTCKCMHVCTTHLNMRFEIPRWLPSILYPSAQRKMKGFLRDWKKRGSDGR